LLVFIQGKMSKTNTKITIDISDHIVEATKSYLHVEGKWIIEQAVEDYFNGQKFYSIKQTLNMLDISDPTLRSWKRRGLILPIIVAGRECYTANEIERVKEAKMRYKRGV